MSGVSEAATVITGHDSFSLSPARLQSQPQTHPDSQMRVTYSDDDGGVFRSLGSPSHPYQSITGGILSSNSNSGEMKRRRGRPRKYGPDGNLPMSMPPGPQPIAAGLLQTQTFSPPPLGGPPPPDSQTSAGASASTAGKRPRGRPPGSANKKKRIEGLGSDDGIGFIPHVITVKAGQDVALTVLGFSQNSPRSVCILSAAGHISSVALRQAASSGGTATYEGRFEILSLSGSYMPSNVNGQISRTGGLSVTLVGPDGRMFGGCVAGVLTAASPVEVIVGSFVAADGNKDEQQQQQQQHYGDPSLRVNLGGGGGISSSPSRGTFSGSSGAPASPLNLSSGACNAAPTMPWK
ncbi:hypothetical protein M569_09286 [Genlisea aurea]|uniref:AT-hook motif nuclear-localized protein n=1 Tax=Genlisea aurea TaxID=192259 RepID=S8DQZ5_9LAMI|nr:hypothetical protein M569_09286 [Genlisea aurea]